MFKSQPQLEKVQQSFRRALKTYDDNAFVQLEIAQTLMKILAEKRDENAQKTHFNSVFEIGCGTGFLTKALLDDFTVDHLVANDLVAECKPIINVFLSEMLSITGNKTLNSWEFVAGDINECDIKPQQDLICSASTLQWVEDVPALLEKFYENLSSNGWLALTSFGPNHFSEIHALNQENVNTGHDLNYLDISEWRNMLETHIKAAFFVENIQTQSVTLWFDSFDELLRHLRNTGVNGNTRRHWSQGMKKDFAMRYEALFSQQGKLPLTYEPVYIVARK